MELLLFLAIAGGAAWLIWRNQRASEEKARKRFDAFVGGTREKPAEWRAATWQGPFERDQSDPGRGYRMTYADAYGEITERTIRHPRGEFLDGRLYVDAWCALRKARRTFRADRIQDLRDPRGDSIYDPFAYFADAAENRSTPRPTERTQHDRALARLKPSLNALIWIAKTDREVDGPELAILMEYADRRLAITKGSTEIDRHSLEAWIDDAAPTKAEALKGLTAIAPNLRLAELFLDFADRIVRSSGEEDPAKTNRLNQLRRAL